MSEDEAKEWLNTRLDVPRETVMALEQFVSFLRAEGEVQNLIAPSTMTSIWTRHILDSAQLLPLAPGSRSWIDLGTGAGFPGLVVAALGAGKVTLVEARRKRAEFLSKAIALLGIQTRAELLAVAAESVPYGRRFDVISARAFAPLERLLTIGQRFADENTRWILPKGRSAQAELDAARQTWQGDFRIEPSITDPTSAIIVAEHVRPRKT